MEPSQGPLSEEMFHSFLQLAVKRQASDVHFEVGYPPTYRVFGELLAAKVPPLGHADTEAIANFVLQAPGSGFGPLDFREVDRSYSLPGVSRFRASIFKQRGSWGAVMRTIPFAVPDFATLNLPPVVNTVAEARRGLVVVSGATGNGKSTTIAAIIHHIIQQERLHVITVEDPIEFIFSSGRGLVIQREVGSDTASYSDALRAALRQDPDVIMVGELRDRESADICLKAAETGHLVITSLHTPDVPRAMGRLVGLFPSDEQETVRARLADNLQAVIALRLLLRADAAGLIPAVEALLATSTVREMIRDATRIKELKPYMETAGADLGMHSFDQYLYKLHEARRISLDTALGSATNRADLERRILIESGGRPA
jgi:twitching motility protein PilT